MCVINLLTYVVQSVYVGDMIPIYTGEHRFICVPATGEVINLPKWAVYPKHVGRTSAEVYMRERSPVDESAFTCVERGLELVHDPMSVTNTTLFCTSVPRRLYPI